MPASKSKGGAARLLSRDANPAAAAPEDASVGPATAEDIDWLADRSAAAGRLSSSAQQPQYDFKVFEDEEEEEEEPGPPKKSSAKCWYSNNDGPPPSSRGEIIAACVYPLAVNIWLWFALWNNEDSTRVIDTEGTAHTITGRRLTVNQVFFVTAAWFCHPNLINAHMWFTMSIVARRHRLEQAGAVAGKGYGARLFAAMQDARMPSQAERTQLAMFMINIVTIFVLAFFESWDEPWVMLAIVVVPVMGTPIVWYMWGSLITLARSKAIEKQRTRSVQFAATAFRGTMMALMLQIVFLLRFAVFSFNMPSDPAGTLFVDMLCLDSNTDSASNSTWLFSALLRDCARESGLVDGGLSNDAEAHTVYLPLLNQFLAVANVELYLASCVVFYCARGQGRLPDRIFIDLDLAGSEAVVLCLLMGQFLSGVVSVAVSTADYSDPDPAGTYWYWWLSWCFFQFCTCGCSVLGVLWMDDISAKLKAALGQDVVSDAEKNSMHTIFASMRFVDGKPLPEAVKLREELEKQNVFLKIVELKAGADINQEVFESIEQAGAFMVFGTSTYGEKTANPACVPPPAPGLLAKPPLPPELVVVFTAFVQLHVLRERVCPQRRQEDDPAAHDPLGRAVRAPTGAHHLRHERARPDLGRGGADAGDSVRR